MKNISQTSLIIGIGILAFQGLFLLGLSQGMVEKTVAQQYVNIDELVVREQRAGEAQDVFAMSFPVPEEEDVLVASTQTNLTPEDVVKAADACKQELSEQVDLRFKKYEEDTTFFISGSEMPSMDLAARLKASVKNLEEELKGICAVPGVFDQLGTSQKVAAQSAFFYGMNKDDNNTNQNSIYEEQVFIDEALLAKMFPKCEAWRNASLVTLPGGSLAGKVNSDVLSGSASPVVSCNTKVEEIVEAQDNMADSVPIWYTVDRKTQLYTETVKNLNLSIQEINDYLRDINKYMTIIAKNTTAYQCKADQE